MSEPVAQQVIPQPGEVRLYHGEWVPFHCVSGTENDIAVYRSPRGGSCTVPLKEWLALPKLPKAGDTKCRNDSGTLVLIQLDGERVWYYAHFPGAAIETAVSTMPLVDWAALADAPANPKAVRRAELSLLAEIEEKLRLYHKFLAERG